MPGFRKETEREMSLLLHICCAPCSIACIDTLRASGIEPYGYWFNPNIHPYTEYRMRKNTLMDYAKSIDLKLDLNDDYGLRPFVKAVANDIDGRCSTCYSMRMNEAARYAAEHGFTQFTSTLFISPYQNHELLKATAENAARQYGIEFYYQDFRPYFRAGQDRARELGLYMQKYCGCIFSEEDRYLAAKRRKKAMREAKLAEQAD